MTANKNWGSLMNVEHKDSNLPEDRLWQPVTAKWFSIVFGAALGYSILRYHVTGEVAVAHFPLFILNKTTSLAAVVFIAFSYLIGRIIPWHNDNPKLKLVVIKFCGLMGFSLAAIHAFFSMCLLSPAYFAKFFDADGRLNLVGELGLAVGVVALWALAMPAITTLPMMPKAMGGIRWKRSQRMGYLCLALIVAHMVVFGFRGWLTPEKWPWGFPPISLLAIAAASVPLVAKLWQLFARRSGSGK
jgi:DMSO/TMAO reductase YedYZ heme-binding membrane subunit